MTDRQTDRQTVPMRGDLEYKDASVKMFLIFEDDRVCPDESCRVDELC